MLPFVSLRFSLVFVSCMLALWAFVSPVDAATLYVSSSGSDNNLGTAAAPYVTIQAAVNNAKTGDTIDIADGTYTGPGNHDIDFGGKNLTVMSQHGAAKTIIDCGVSDRSAKHRGFYLHSGESSAIISGLTIENGYDGNTSNGGGGILLYNVGATLRDCIIKDNKIGTSGGGVKIISGYDSKKIDTVAVIRCTITGNEADNSGGGVSINCQGGSTITIADSILAGNEAGNDGGGLDNFNGSYAKGGAIIVTGSTLMENMAGGNGGGMHNINRRLGTVTVVNCVLNDNSTTGNGDNGGGIFDDNGSSYPDTVKNCTLTGNTTTDGNGGGIYNRNVSQSGGLTKLTNCILTGNTAPSGEGGGIYNSNEGGSPISVTNCTLTGNAAKDTGGIYNLNSDSGGTYKNTNTIALTNDILYGDLGKEIANDPNSTSNALATHCDVEGGYAGIGNIETDPLFANSPTDLHVKHSSPCRGTGAASGAPKTDRNETTRPNPPSIGAYE